MFTIPVILFTFKRPDMIRRQMDILEKVEPETLLVISDAARENVPGELALVEETRKIFEQISWKCKLIRNFADVNMGCDKRITSGLDWAFDIVDRAIILEDDCIPYIDFFRYCETLLKKYESDSRIYYISGTNPIRSYLLRDSYTFTYRGITWGWATWSRAWKTFDYVNFEKAWDSEKKEKIKWPFLLPGDRRSWIRQLDANRSRGDTPWDFCWFWHTMKNHGMSIVPKTNLIENIGFGIGATHTFEKSEKYDGKTDALEFPLSHPLNVKLDKHYYFENWKYEKPNYLKKLFEIDFYRRQWEKYKNEKIIFKRY